MSSAENPDRRSPDGCSPHSSRKGSQCGSSGDVAAGAAGVSAAAAATHKPLIPTLSVTDELQQTVSLSVTPQVSCTQECNIN